MAKREKSNPSWINVKKAIEARDHAELVKLVGDLYRNSKANRDFLHARFSIGEDPLKPYKEIIKESVYPDMYSNKPVRISRAESAIGDYRKAVGDPMGVVELMLYLAECGIDVACRFGDMPDRFCSSVVESYRLAARHVERLPAEETRRPFIARLDRIRRSPEAKDWAYWDSIDEAFQHAFGYDEDVEE